MIQKTGITTPPRSEAKEQKYLIGEEIQEADGHSKLLNMCSLDCSEQEAQTKHAFKCKFDFKRAFDCPQPFFK